MNISLDFDKTYTEDPVMWNQIVKIMRDRGHKVYVVTMRFPPPHQEGEEVDTALQGIVDGFFYTSRRAKAPYMQQYQPDTPIHVWMDDSPWWLLRDSL